MRTAAVLSALAVVASGCTSVSWTDSEGRRRHLGLVVVAETVRGGQTEVDRWTLGADLRVGGHDPGWSAGAGRRRCVYAAPRDVSGPRLVREYLASVRDGAGAEEPATRTLHLFHYAENASPRAQWVRSWNVGADVTWGRARAGLALPFVAEQRLTPEAFADGLVLVAGAADDASDPLLRCWRLLDSPPDWE